MGLLHGDCQWKTHYVLPLKSNTLGGHHSISGGGAGIIFKKFYNFVQTPREINNLRHELFYISM